MVSREPLHNPYANLDNALDRAYNSGLGYPGLPISVRAGLHFRIGGD
ncbi:MAG: hypothetical protein NVS9B15_09830 [Acidobacteriaceae bacterium]